MASVRQVSALVLSRALAWPSENGWAGVMGADEKGTDQFAMAAWKAVIGPAGAAGAGGKLAVPIVNRASAQSAPSRGPKDSSDAGIGLKASLGAGMGRAPLRYET